jgi:hypothetical protein
MMLHNSSVQKVCSFFDFWKNQKKNMLWKSSLAAIAANEDL